METARSSYIINSAFLEISKQTLSPGSAVTEKDLRLSLSKMITTDFFLLVGDFVKSLSIPFLGVITVSSILSGRFHTPKHTLIFPIYLWIWAFCEAVRGNPVMSLGGTILDFVKVMIPGHFRCNCEEICQVNRTTVTLANWKDTRRKQRVGRKTFHFPKFKLRVLSVTVHSAKT